MNEFRVKTNKLFTLIPIVIGGFLIFVAMDFFLLHRFFKFSENVESGGLIIAGSLGLLFFIFGIKGLFAPSTVLIANGHGITIDPTRHTIGNKARKEPISIHWSEVSSISEGKIISGYSNRRRGTRIRFENSVVGGRTERKARYSPAIKILMSQTINLDHCDINGVLQTRTGTPAEDITNEDRDYFSEQELEEHMKTECLISKHALPKNINQSIQSLTSLMNRNK